MTLREQYDQQGFAFPVPILTPAELVEARAAFAAIEAEMGRDKAQLGVLQRHLTDRAIWHLAAHPKVLDAVAAVSGPDIVLMATHFFVKYPEAGEKHVAWHQDVTYWGFEPPQATTVWLALDDADVANGCMRILPGTHRRGVLPHGRSLRPGNLLSQNQEIAAELLDEASAVDCPLLAGEASLHDGLAVHGSNPNRSNRRRCGMTIRFATPAVQLAKQAFWAPMLLRGQDTHQRLTLQPLPFPLPV